MPESSALPSIQHDSQDTDALIDQLNERLPQLAGQCVLIVGASQEQKMELGERLARKHDLGFHLVRIPSLLGDRFSQTRGNMREAFDRSQGGGAVILFDEVETFFEEQDSREDIEREFGYLCQRSDTFSGVMLMALDRPEYEDDELLRQAVDLVVRF